MKVSYKCSLLILNNHLITMQESRTCWFYSSTEVRGAAGRTSKFSISAKQHSGSGQMLRSSREEGWGELPLTTEGHQVAPNEREIGKSPRLRVTSSAVRI